MIRWGLSRFHDNRQVAGQADIAGQGIAGANAQLAASTVMPATPRVRA